MRFFWLAALGAIAVVMAVLTPYVFRTEAPWRAVVWSLMLVCTVVFIAVLVRAERLFRTRGHRTSSDTSEP